MRRDTLVFTIAGHGARPRGRLHGGELGRRAPTGRGGHGTAGSPAAPAGATPPRLNPTRRRPWSLSPRGSPATSPSASSSQPLHGGRAVERGHPLVPGGARPQPVARRRDEPTSRLPRERGPAGRGPRRVRQGPAGGTPHTATPSTTADRAPPDGPGSDAGRAWEELLRRHPDDPQLQGLQGRIEQIRATAAPGSDPRDPQDPPSSSLAAPAAPRRPGGGRAFAAAPARPGHRLPRPGSGRPRTSSSTTYAGPTSPARGRSPPASRARGALLLRGLPDRPGPRWRAPPRAAWTSAPPPYQNRGVRPRPAAPAGRTGEPPCP